MFVVGGLATALGVTLWIAAPKPDAPTTAAGLSIGGTF
jgi:hypothetical protein